MKKSQSKVFGIVGGDRKARKRQRRELAYLSRQAEMQLRAAEPRIDIEAGFPRKSYPAGGQKRERSSNGTAMMREPGVNVAGHTAATAYPYPSGPDLGAFGPPVGVNIDGGGTFCIDPWELYKAGIISGMSMLLFGTVGTGKSTLAKCWCTRLIQFGKKLAVASDLKGEWTDLIQQLGGVVIQIGTGLPTRLNPLEEGMRPSVDSMGNDLSDDGWAQMVRTRRMSIMETVIKILTGQEELSADEHTALDDAIDGATRRALEESRTPTVLDVSWALLEGRNNEISDEELERASRGLAKTIRRLHSGDLAGMFDGESTVVFDPSLPAVSIDTSSLRGSTQKARRVASACCGTWIEAMVTNPDSGHRVVVYEEGWDAVTNRADLQRMVENWKLARDYGIFNILIMHKVTDLKMAGDSGSQMAAMAQSLLADADIKVIYRQDPAALRATTAQLELNEKERTLLPSLSKGTGLWRINQKTFRIHNTRTKPEIELFDTDKKLRTTTAVDEISMIEDEHGKLITDWAA